jgi:preprotein translocase subunit SecF
MDKMFNFMGYRKSALIFSGLLIIGSIISLGTQGLNLGLDFTGGTLVEILYEDAADLKQIRNTLETNNYNGAQVVNFGSDRDVLVRLPQANTSDLGDQVVAVLRDSSAKTLELKRIEYVGPQVGEELREQGGLGLLIAIVGVMIYVAIQFQFKFSLGAVIALIHDIIITLGLFSLLQLDFDLTVLAALLAVIGYSLNDTIVVSDRIRENFRVVRRASPEEVINLSLNQTLGRTVMTSLTTLLVLTSLFVFGGDIIHGFATALIFGVLIGTYSSIFVAASSLLTLNVTKEDLIVPLPENGDVDDMP